MSKGKHYERAKNSLDTIFERVEEINIRLRELTGEIKKSQPNHVAGAVTLHLYDCGKGCLGCPHPKWLSWFLREKPGTETKETIFLTNAVKNPLRRLKRTGFFSETYPVTRLLVEEALALVDERTRLIEAVSRLNRKVPVK